MANATKKELKVEKVVIEKKEVITLELDEYEAKILRMFVGSVYGNSHTSARGILDNIFYALDKVDSEYTSADNYISTRATMKDNQEVEQYLKGNK